MQHAILEVRKVSGRERQVLEALLGMPDGVSQRDVLAHMRQAPSQATLSRMMQSLVARGLLVKEGETRGARFSLSADARRVAADPRRRAPIVYDPTRITGYVPNVSHWLPADALSRMQAAIRAAGGKRWDASTYSKGIAERFLIDLSWASSVLEGNTYDHLSTEMLIKYGKNADGKDKQETAMILNHKAAISSMLEGLDAAFPGVVEVRRRHVLMMRDLLDPAELGVIRHNPVQVTGTAYRPSSDHVLLSMGLAELLSKAASIEEPCEAAFFLLAGISYIQAFSDGNKRTGRLVCNEPLLRAGCPPLSFMDMDKLSYVLGLIEFYEVGVTDLLGDVIARSYEATAGEYMLAVSGARTPSMLALRERERMGKALGTIFAERILDAGIPHMVETMFGDLGAEEREEMVSLLVETSARTSPVSAFLYGAREEDVIARQEATGRLVLGM